MICAIVMLTCLVTLGVIGLASHASHAHMEPIATMCADEEKKYELPVRPRGKGRMVVWTREHVLSHVHLRKRS